MTALICEGVCNPNLAVVDAVVAASVMHHNDGVAPRVTDREAAIQRSLVYTPHRVSGDHGTCLTCGTTRRYGYTGF